MRNMKLLWIATLGLGLTMFAAACSGDMSGTGVEPPKEPGAATAEPGLGGAKATEVPGQPAPGQPGAGTTDPENLAAALALHGDTERIAAGLLAEDCGMSAQCVAELQAVQEYVKTACSGAAANPDCPPTIGKFNDGLSAAQLNGQAPIPVVFPQVKDVAFVITMMEKGASGEGAGAAAADAGAVVAGVVQGLATATEPEIDWATLQTKIAEASATGGEDIAKQVEAALKDMADNSTAASLVAGDAVPVADAAVLLTAIAQNLK